MTKAPHSKLSRAVLLLSAVPVNGFPAWLLLSALVLQPPQPFPDASCFRGRLHFGGPLAFLHLPLYLPGDVFALPGLCQCHLKMQFSAGIRCHYILALTDENDKYNH